MSEFVDEVRQLEFETSQDRQIRFQGLLQRIPEEPNLGLVLEIGRVLKDSKGSIMLTAYIMREATRGLLRPEYNQLVDGEEVSIYSFPKTLFDKDDGIFGDRAKEMERREIFSYITSPQFDVGFLARWEISFKEHYKEEFNNVETI